MTCVILHGLGQRPSDWEDVRASLPEDQKVICPDLAELCPNGLYDELYTGIVKLCDALPEPFDLCGLSLGAVLALHYAVEHPHSVRALCLMAPQYRMPRHLLAVQDVLFCLLPAAAFADTGLDRKRMCSLIRSMSRLDLTGQLDGLTMPVRVVCGARDLANRKAARTLAQRVGQGDVCWIAGAGHEVNRDAPQQTAAAMGSLFQSDPA